MTGIDPHTLANGIDAGFSEDSLECLGLTFKVLVAITFIF